MTMNENSISVLTGLTLVKIEGCERGSESIHFETSCGRKFTMYHYQDCCETVDIDDVCGNVDDLIGEPLLMAEEASNDQYDDVGAKDQYDDSYTWTFYKLATVKGYVTIKWYGTSNGYYSESVDFVEVTNNDLLWL